MKYVILGVGNAYRRDDGVGLAVAARLQGLVPGRVDIIPCEQEPSRLIDAWQDADTALVVDAIESGAEAGTLVRFDASEIAIPARMFRTSTHAFGVGDAIELARVLGRLPARVFVYGVEGAEFQAGEGLSAAVEAAIEPTAAMVLEDLDRALREEEESCTSKR
jgi:hydrogenase maturation protease